MSRLKIRSEKGAVSANPKGGRIKRKTGSAMEAIMELTDTYPVKTNTIANTTRQRGTAMRKRASSIPPKVPTPLPPLNPANMVYVCPRTAAKPHKI